MKNKLRRWFHRKMMAYLFNAVTEYDILKQVGTRFKYRDELLTDKQVQALAEQATEILNMQVMDVIIDDMRYLGNKRIYLDSKNENDLIFGKALLYYNDVLVKKLNNLAKLKER